MFITRMEEEEEQRWFSGQGYDHLRISSITHQITMKDSISTYPPPPIMADFQEEANNPSGSKISPALLFIIVILAVLFFLSGILHLLIRFLTKNHSPSQPGRTTEGSNTDTLQRQLQQLFHLHDSGLDQAFIDALPVFSYKEIVGPMEPFDCAVCLCGFKETDQLRLLPMCSHAFHINCIDTWLLANSTCPLCRGALLNPGFSMENPIFEYEDFREAPLDVDDYPFAMSRKRVEISEIAEKGVYQVRLGKFKKLNENGGGSEVGETSNSKLDGRRCYSMGSYQYVVGDANLRVALSQDRGKLDVVGGKGKSFNSNTDGKKIGIGSKMDSYSVSKIWLWSKKGKFASSSSDQLEGSSPPNLDLPWMQRTQGI